MYTNIEDFIENTNFEQLRSDKMALLTAIAEFERAGNQSMANKLDGILHFIDNFQDMCGDGYGVDHKKVYTSGK